VRKYSEPLLLNSKPNSSMPYHGRKREIRKTIVPPPISQSDVLSLLRSTNAPSRFRFRREAGVKVLHPSGEGA
jgi:hypothetical protein